MFLYNFLLGVHLLVTVVLILVVLVQSGKGAEVGAVFGGGGAVLGGLGATTILHKLTIGLAAAFMVTSLLLAIGAPKTKRSIFQPITTSSAPVSMPLPTGVPMPTGIPDSAPAAPSPEATPAAAPASK